MLFVFAVAGVPPPASAALLRYAENALASAIRSSALDSPVAPDPAAATAATPSLPHMKTSVAMAQPTGPGIMLPGGFAPGWSQLARDAAAAAEEASLAAADASDAAGGDGDDAAFASMPGRTTVNELVAREPKQQEDATLQPAFRWPLNSSRVAALAAAEAPIEAPLDASAGSTAAARVVARSRPHQAPAAAAAAVVATTRTLRDFTLIQRAAQLASTRTALPSAAAYAKVRQASAAVPAQDAAAGMSADPRPRGKPNIVYLMADDIGPAYGPWNNRSLLHTPAIDELARHGATFTQAYADTALCAPSRYSALTGNHAHRGHKRWGVWGYGAPSAMVEGQQTLGEMLQAEGYATLFAGKWHLGGGVSQESCQSWCLPKREKLSLKCSWDACKGCSGCGNADGGDELSTRAPDGPLQHGFHRSRTLWRGVQESPRAFFDDDRDRLLPTDMPYADWTPCAGGSELAALAMMGDGDVAPWNATRDVWTANAGPCLGAWAVEAIRTAPTPFFLYYSSQAAHAPHRPPAQFLDQGKVRGASRMGNTADMMVEADRALGALVSAVEKRGQLANTIVVFTADNGQGSLGSCTPADPPTCKTRDWPNFQGPTMYVRDDGFAFDFVGGLRGYKALPYEGGLRVPLAVRWGDATMGYRIPAGTRSAAIVSHVDLVRTLLRLTGARVPDGQAVDGLDMSAHFLSPTTVEGPRTESWHTDGGGRSDKWYVARVGRWKWLLRATCTSDHWDRWDVACFEPDELYDMQADARERVNLLDDSNPRIAPAAAQASAMLGAGPWHPDNQPWGLVGRMLTA